MLKEILIRELENTISRLKRGLCELSLEQMESMIKLIAHEPISKAQAYEYLRISRSLFDTLVKNGALPKGLKRVGFKELVWYKDELDLYNENSNT